MSAHNLFQAQFLRQKTQLPQYMKGDTELVKDKRDPCSVLFFLILVLGYLTRQIYGLADSQHIVWSETCK